jgi:DNA-binding HxlR family transcriptional regulator
MDRSKKYNMKTECIGDRVSLKGKTYPYTVCLAMDLIGGKWKAVIYNLTDFGRTFIPVLNSITTWGNQIVSDKGEFVTNEL